MLDIKFIRENPEIVKAGANAKGIDDLDIDHILSIDKKYRELLLVVQNLREKRNTVAREKNIEKGREIKEKLEKEESALSAVEEELKNYLLKIPNIPAKDVKTGKNEDENDIIKKYKEPKKYDFTPLDHLQLGESLDIIDVERAAKVSGARFAYLKNEGVFLEFALVQLAFEILTKEGFIPIIPPELIKSENMRALGYTEQGGEEDMFYVQKDDFFLVGTAEHSIVSMHKDEVLNEKELPKRYVGFSSSFRREAGSYGKDTRGILRVHQFDKVEMVSFTTQENDDREHDYLLSLEEKLFQMLEIPYQVIKMCSGDLGFPVARKYDIEAWIPSQEKYREVTSASTTGDFQARRLNIKYKKEGKNEYVHILNGTAFAIGRTIITILENHQQKDGTILIPDVLKKYLNFDKIIPKK